MIPAKNPTDAQISVIISRSEHQAAKWLKDLDTGDLYFWEAEKAFHKHIADSLHISSFDKGIAVNDT